MKHNETQEQQTTNTQKQIINHNNTKIKTQTTKTHTVTKYTQY